MLWFSFIPQSWPAESFSSLDSTWAYGCEHLYPSLLCNPGKRCKKPTALSGDIEGNCLTTWFLPEKRCFLFSFPSQKRLSWEGLSNTLVHFCWSHFKAQALFLSFCCLWLLKGSNSISGLRDNSYIPKPDLFPQIYFVFDSFQRTFFTSSHSKSSSQIWGRSSIASRAK